MTSAEIRQSFLDFFREKQHTIVPSSSLLPDSPNLLFTNAGMNQFVPIFLGQVKCAYQPPRVADTQKCIRAGGKHNDLDDVGLDTYHHTFFEMLGNWSFGDYFKKEAIEWAWELVVERWKFPAERLYATVYCPEMARWNEELARAIAAVKASPGQIHWEDENPNDQSATNRPDRVAIQYWAPLFLRANLDPLQHIIPGDRKDNFWMMGETGPCGPCSELHVDLTPAGDTKGKLVNAGDPRCIEIWNLVFIQFNANPDGSFTPLPAKHVDTGMGFERVTSIMQGTKSFTDFANAKISNYETDIFRPIFDELGKLSGKAYASTLPRLGSTGDTEQEKIDVAFRVIADHIRTLSFAIADRIEPGNTDRNYVLRRILRRAIRYGRTLGFHEPFFYKLVDVLARTIGKVFPEIRERRQLVKDVILREEEAFNRTLDNGIALFNLYAHGFDEACLRCGILENEFLSKESDERDFVNRYTAYMASRRLGQPSGWGLIDGYGRFEWAPTSMIELMGQLNDASSARHAAALIAEIRNADRIITGDFAFKLYDTYGFPLDLTELMARERGLTVDVAGFNRLMEEQRTRARSAQKREVISVSNIETSVPTRFVGYDTLQTSARVIEVVSIKRKTAVILDASTCYAEMGGQVGDTGELSTARQRWHITNTQKTGATWLHLLEENTAPPVDTEVTLAVAAPRRAAIERHHTVTHLLHWALHAGVSIHATQKGSFVGPDKLTFDFNSPALTASQVRTVERLVNERIVENANVSWTEVPYAEVKSRADVMQFFGDKYGDTVRVVQIGGGAHQLDGFSMELCAGTHVRATGQIGLFRIVAEGAIAAGVRRIEAVAGLPAYELVHSESERLRQVATRLGTPLPEVEKKVETLLEQHKEMEKQLQFFRQKQAAHLASTLLEKIRKLNSAPAIIEPIPGASGDELQAIAEALKGQFKGVIVLAGATPGNVALLASVSPEFSSVFHAGKIIQTIAPIVGGKGGGRADMARGAGKEPAKVPEALAAAKEFLR